MARRLTNIVVMVGQVGMIIRAVCLRQPFLSSHCFQIDKTLTKKCVKFYHLLWRIQSGSAPVLYPLPLSAFENKEMIIFDPKYVPECTICSLIDSQILCGEYGPGTLWSIKEAVEPAIMDTTCRIKPAPPVMEILQPPLIWDVLFATLRTENYVKYHH